LQAQEFWLSKSGQAGKIAGSASELAESMPHQGQPNLAFWSSGSQYPPAISVLACL
jgi:hypothetical protein